MTRVSPALLTALLLFVPQVLFTLACATLLWVRMSHTESGELGFLAWNLFLAWTPLLLAVVTFTAHRTARRSLWWAIPAGAWLLFLPNGPYLVTDFIHLGHTWESVPLWFDLLMLGCFAATGVLVAYSSLFIVQLVLTERAGRLTGWAATLGAVLLSSIGIVIGRILRFNSWDVLLHPDTLLLSMYRSASGGTLRTPEMLTVVLAMGLVLLVGYVVFATACAAATFEPRRRAR